MADIRARLQAWREQRASTIVRRMKERFDNLIIKTLSTKDN